MNIRAHIVKALYPHCSDEVKILVDQMRSNPDKFSSILGVEPYQGNFAWEWVLRTGHFELIDHLVVKHQSKLLHTALTKQQILAGLLDAEEFTKRKALSGNMFDSINKQQPRNKIWEYPPASTKYIDYTSSVYADGRKPIK